MTETELYEGLQLVFDGVFKRRDVKVTPTLTATEVAGWDSFRQVSLIVASEMHFGIRLTGADIDELGNVGDLAKAIAQRYAESIKPV